MRGFQGLMTGCGKARFALRLVCFANISIVEQGQNTGFACGRNSSISTKHSATHNETKAEQTARSVPDG
jgi:hypothetical protein